MRSNGIDHTHHGWALLALRFSELRSNSAARRHLAEICECYSLAVLHLERLRHERANAAVVEEYEETLKGIEEDVAYYLSQSGNTAGEAGRRY